MLTADAKIDLSKLRQVLDKGGPAQTMLDRLVVDYSIPYVPFDTGTLSRSPYAVTDFGSGEVVYPGPYAHYQYMGEVYGPNIPIMDSETGDIVQWISRKGERKHPTGRQLQYNTATNPLAGSFWIERMKADRMADIVKAVGKLVADQ